MVNAVPVGITAPVLSLSVTTTEYVPAAARLGVADKANPTEPTVAVAATFCPGVPGEIGNCVAVLIFGVVAVTTRPVVTLPAVYVRYSCGCAVLILTEPELFPFAVNERPISDETLLVTTIGFASTVPAGIAAPFASLSPTTTVYVPDVVRLTGAERPKLTVATVVGGIDVGIGVGVEFAGEIASVVAFAIFGVVAVSTRPVVTPVGVKVRYTSG